MLQAKCWPDRVYPKTSIRVAWSRSSCLVKIRSERPFGIPRTLSSGAEPLKGLGNRLIVPVSGEFLLRPRLVFGKDHDNVVANDSS